ncbi:MAG: hypothetical protein IT259_00210 [Saprospiraceae bacterium]|nr:hypothetical protein [Saprospiraceae bacterium]
MSAFSDNLFSFSKLDIVQFIVFFNKLSVEEQKLVSTFVQSQTGALFTQKDKMPGLKGSVLSYEAPFLPAINNEDWEALT